MGRKSLIYPFDLLRDITPDMSADITSNAVVWEQVDIGVIDIAWNGTSPVGEIKVETKDEGGSWIDYAPGSTLAVSGNTDSMKIFCEVQANKYLRIRYVRTSGAGTLTASFRATTRGA